MSADSVDSGVNSPPAAAATREPHGWRRERARPEPSTYGPFVPMVIFFGATLAWLVFQFYQLRLEQTALNALHVSQDNLVQQSQRVRANLDALATQTRRLADAGNPNARLVVEELSRRGITIQTPSAASAPRR